MTDEEIRKNYLIEWRKGLWTQIRQKEDAIWRFISFYAAAILLVAGFVKGTSTGQAISTLGGSLILLTLFVVSFWGVLIVLDANFWLNRNLLFIGNIERELLPESDIDVLIPRSYTEPRFEYAKSYEIHMHVLFFTVFLSLMAYGGLVLKRGGVSDSKELAVAGLIAVTFCLALSYIQLRDCKWLEHFMNVKNEAPGRNPIMQNYPRAFDLTAFWHTSVVALWGWFLAFVGCGIFVFLACLSQTRFGFQRWMRSAIPISFGCLIILRLVIFPIVSHFSLCSCRRRLDQLREISKMEIQRCVLLLDRVRRADIWVQRCIMTLTSVIWLLTILGILISHIGE